MTTALLDDEFWRVIEPLLPVRKRRFHHPGRKRLDDRRTLAGILFVLRTGIAWKRVPRCGCGWYLTSLQTAVSGWPGTARGPHTLARIARFRLPSVRPPRLLRRFPGAGVPIGFPFKLDDE